MTRPINCPDWCIQGQRCALGEHRANPIVIDLSGLARGTLTRVRPANNADQAEIRIRLALHPTESIARHQLQTLLTGLDQLLGSAAVAKPTTKRTTR